VTWDDHEVENNYAGLMPQFPNEAPEFPARRAAGYQAWWEHQPVRLPPPAGPDLTIYRSFDWGRLARFHVLDGRQYRSNQPCDDAGDFGPTCDARVAPTQTMLGEAQEAWIGMSLAESRARWDVLANQTVMTSMPLAGVFYNRDQWDGYAAARARLFDQVRAGGVENAVVITGDIHAAGAGSLVGENPDGSSSTDAVGTELVGSSISSRFDDGLAELAEQLVGALPHIAFADMRHRGYMVCDATDTELVTRYQVVDSTDTPDAPVRTAATFTTLAGTPGVQV
jgi:alkaline phosphatase D